MDRALEDMRERGMTIVSEDIGRLSPLTPRRMSVDARGQSKWAENRMGQLPEPGFTSQKKKSFLPISTAHPFQASYDEVSSPLGYDHVNLLGRYTFSLSDEVRQGAFHPLRDLEETEPEESVESTQEEVGL